MRFSAFALILRIFDEAKAKDFYLGFLGFGLDWEHRFEPDMPLYAQISLGECVIHLSEHHGDASPGSAVRVPSTTSMAITQRSRGRAISICGAVSMSCRGARAKSKSSIPSSIV